MKVVRSKTVWGTLLRVLSSPGGRLSIDYISLTDLEVEELQHEYGVVFQWADPGSARVGNMHTESWDIEGTVPVRVEAQDKHSRARRQIKGNGSERTR